jgi:hypothetical protein
MKRQILVQLQINGQAAWQVQQDVPAAVCRKMSATELQSIGESIALILGELVVGSVKPAVTAAAAAPAPQKKRR